MTADIASYFELSDDDLDSAASNSLAPATGTTAYQFKVTDWELNEWPSGDARLDIECVVNEGSHKGQSGPRLQWQFAPYTQDLGDDPDPAKVAERVDQKAAQTVRNARAVLNGGSVAIPQGATDEQALAAIGTAIKGAEFIGVVGRDRNDFPRIQRIHALSSPPKSYAAEATPFTFN